MEALTRIIADQNTLLSNLKKLKVKVDLLQSEQLTKGYVTVLIERVDAIYASYSQNNECVNEAMKDRTIDTTNIPYFIEDFGSEFEDHYMLTKAFLYDSLPSEPSCMPAAFQSTFLNVPTRNETISNAAKLPKISVPTFTGDYLEWFSFRDLYTSLVHDNSSLSKIQKMFYLKSSLTGEAASLIKHICATDANYDLAWKTLQDRFHNKRVIVDTLLKKLFNVPKCTSPSHIAVKALLDTTKECLASLTNLDVLTKNWDPLIVHITAQKLDPDTRKDWEQTLKATKELPPLEDLYSFLETTFRTLETLGSTSAKTKSPAFCQRQSLKTFNVNKSPSCPCCQKPHLLYKCWAFRSYSLPERRQFVERSLICINCLMSGHRPPECKSTNTCQLCNSKHHTLLHGAFQSRISNNGTVTKSSACQLQNNHVSTHTITKQRTASHVLLGTILLKIETPNGPITARALLDQGSQGSFITEQLIQTYKLPCRSIHMQIHGIDRKQTNCVNKSTCITLRPCGDNDFSVAVEAFVLPNLSTYLPHSDITPLNLTVNAHFTLADPQYYKSQPIDMLLGADVYGLIIKKGQHVNQSGLLYQETHFSWVVSGPVEPSNTIVTISNHHCQIDDQLKLFWEQEEMQQPRLQSGEELECENHFSSTHKRDATGLCIVSLPFKSVLKGDPLPIFENSHLNAVIRLRNMERTLQRKPAFHSEYCNFMEEYKSLGHMQLVGEYPRDVEANSYYLPHHGVEKISSATTKLRVVFDGSSKYRNQRSLNEELAAGPALQHDLSQVILRWRIHKIALCSDIEKMFRQIAVDPDHQRYQQILWRKQPTDPIEIYRLATVTYGTKPAPFLAIRSLQQLARDECEKYPVASEKLLQDIYVDDVITGADNLTEALYLQKELCKLLNAGGCSLRKWASNSTELLTSIPVELRDCTNSIELNNDHYIKALGLQWRPFTDCFSFLVKFDPPLRPTKRNLLSDSSKLFDILGWLAPSTIIAKMLFQKLWLVGTDWDDQLPDNIRAEWTEYRHTLRCLENIKIDRFIGTSKGIKCDLHGFGDASEVGFAAVVYSRTVMSNGEVVVQLLQAKTKVAPLKTLSIPKLELCAAHLLAKLMVVVSQSLQGCVGQITLWSDSTTVLAWLRSQPIRWTVYVANRVADIQRLTTISQWRYVPTKDNPADCASKGVMPRDLPDHALWWHGPDWLKKNSEAWPTDINSTLNTALEQRKSIQVTHINANSYPDILLKYSSLTKTLYVTAYILRFHHNCIHKESRRTGYLSARELQLALNQLLTISQNVDFHNEIKQILAARLPIQNCITKLCPFVDEDGLLRVGGRLKLADVPATMRHPLLFLFSDAHIKTLHGGIQIMLNFIRRKYWVSNARNIAQSVLKRCLICYKYTAKTAHQLMGNLPAVRLTPARPFLHSGVDYAGPVYIRQSSLRNAKSSKGYICIFLCMVTKAIHLEAVSSLTTEAFLASFRRFVSRRGKCTEIYSDCCTNFVGASNALRIMHQRSCSSTPEDLRAILANEGTTWNFIPPASPHFGGLWEAGVKSTKYHLKRIIQERALNFEELTTLLYQIEACLNSRPLCPLNEDVESCDALTPAHFLIGEPTINIPDESLLNFTTAGLNRWRMVERMKQHFWRRWHSEYLSRLQSRPKWATVRQNAGVGDLVLLHDDRCPPGSWPLARITQVHPGEDGLIRVVTLKCHGKVFKRPIRKICFVPVLDPLGIPTSAAEDFGSTGTAAASRGVAIQPGDKSITSDGLADHQSQALTD